MSVPLLTKDTCATCGLGVRVGGNKIECHRQAFAQGVIAADNAGRPTLAGHFTFFAHMSATDWCASHDKIVRRPQQPK